jgi:hypothetical protein
MYLCILDDEGNKRLHRNVLAKPREFLNAIRGFRDDLVVGVECMFTWYWLADLCLDESIKFILGHLLTADAGCLLLAASRQATLSSTQGDDEFETA